MSDPTPNSRESRRLTFSRSRRLVKPGQFRAVYHDGRRAAAMPLVVFALPNALDHSRIGFSIPRQAGGAVARNRIRRLLREAFRRRQHDLPGPYDLVVNVQRHDPLLRDEYEQCLMKAVNKLHRQWMKRSESPPMPTPASDERSDEGSAFPPGR